MQHARITIEQLAQHLGLSKFSVSRALSGKSGVGEETRARVQRAAARFGYHGAHAAPPAGGQVLFVMQDQDPVSSELWVNMLHGAEREGARRGFAIVPRQARQFVNAVVGERTVGVILAVNKPDSLLERALGIGLPIVCGGYCEAMTRVDRVVGDDWAGGVAVARLLAGLGHRCIGFVRGEPGLVGRTERMRGLRDGSHDVAGIELCEIGFAEPDGFRDAFTSLVQSGIAPTALFCAHDGMAITVISELLRLGIRVPDDISVVGFNDFICATQIAPQLTTVRMPQEALGELMVRCLAMRLAARDGTQLPPLKIALTPEIIERRSTTQAAPPVWLGKFDTARAAWSHLSAITAASLPVPT